MIITLGLLLFFIDWDEDPMLPWSKPVWWMDGIVWASLNFLGPLSLCILWSIDYIQVFNINFQTVNKWAPLIEISHTNASFLASINTSHQSNLGFYSLICDGPHFKCFVQTDLNEWLYWEGRLDLMESGSHATTITRTWKGPPSSGLQRDCLDGSRWVRSPRRKYFHISVQ